MLVVPSLASAFERDSHYYLRFGLSLATCFDWEESHLIASGDWGMDENPATHAEMNPVQRKNKIAWHAFGHSDGRFYELWHRTLEEQDLELRLVKLGQFMHFLEDWESHAGYGVRMGHARDTYREIARCAWTGFHEFNCCAFSPLPNTEAFFELQEERGLQPTDPYYYSLFGYMDITDYRSWHPRWGHARLRAMIYTAYATFYGLNYLFRPWRLFAEMWQYGNKTSQGKLGKLIRGLARNRKLQSGARKSVPTS